MVSLPCQWCSYSHHGRMKDVINTTRICQKTRKKTPRFPKSPCNHLTCPYTSMWCSCYSFLHQMLPFQRNFSDSSNRDSTCVIFQEYRSYPLRRKHNQPAEEASHFPGYKPWPEGIKPLRAFQTWLITPVDLLYTHVTPPTTRVPSWISLAVSSGDSWKLVGAPMSGLTIP